MAGFLRYPAGSSWVHLCSSCAWRTAAARSALVWQHRERAQAGAGAVAPESRPKAAGARGRGTRPGVTQA